ncbi:MAG: hypothetical protein A2X76_04625 [Lysobacterales bacterium GWF1_69_6]|nr:MAG: hypothetical protein A2X76_04625 [Xanthomonadales bacterium GWF1_69_6]
MERLRQLTFSLQPDEGWPPVAAECLPIREHAEGISLAAPPLFISGLAVGDVFSVTDEVNDQVTQWSVLSQSGHSTIWVMGFGDFDIGGLLAAARGIGCDTASFSSSALGAIDVPPHVSAAAIDALLSQHSDEEIAVAYPAWRHGERAPN